MKPNAVNVVLSLITANDRDSLRDLNVLKTIGHEADWPRIEEAATLLDSIWKGFDYTKSPEFEERLRGKSESIVAMSIKFAGSPERAKEARDRFEGLLAARDNQDELLRLLPVEQHEALRRVLVLLKPDELP